MAYRVVYPKRVLAHFERMCRDAQQREALAAVEAAAQVIHSELQRVPREFGDPCFGLAGMDVDIYVRSVTPLLVYYAVHRTKNVVFVKSIAWLAGPVGE